MNRIDEARLHRAILHSVSDGVLVLDDDLLVVAANRAAEALTGHAAEDLVGRRCTEILGGALCRLLEGHACAPARVRETGEAVRDAEVDLPRKGGGIATAEVSVSILETPEGAREGVVVLLRDRSEIRRLRDEVRGRYRLGALVGRSRAMREVFRAIERAAATDSTVLLLGETGTGKELAARALHHLSPRASGPFVAVNVAALPESLAESELFGHVRGAFTGAVADRAGKFEAADGGTLFLDEVAESPYIQLRLLRAIEEREIVRVGSNRVVRVNVRLVAATNRDAEEAVRAGRLREDLFYRLNVLAIRLPPLRDRPEDIPLLAEHFLERLRREEGIECQGIDDPAMAALGRYAWPGNVRELAHAIEAAAIRCAGGVMGLGDLPEAIRTAAHRAGARRRRRGEASGPTAEEVRRVLRACRGNRSAAARKLGISRTTLWKRLKGSVAPAPVESSGAGTSPSSADAPAAPASGR